jgi:hypothetical protein
MRRSSGCVTSWLVKPVDIIYRGRQFINALYAAPSPAQIDQIRPILSPKLLSLFLSMQPGEIAHSLKIWQDLTNSGSCPQDVQVAALLHDVGKTRSPLSVWDRIVIVLARTFFPKRVKRWGKNAGDGWQTGWRRPFVVAENHPEWGAQMAEGAGASPVTVMLIRYHQDGQYSQQQPYAESFFPAEIQPYLDQLIQLDNEY